MEDRRLRAKWPESLTVEALEALSVGFTADEAESPWKDREKALGFCLEQLSGRGARFIQDRYHRGLSIEAMAEEAGMKLDALYQTLSRLRRQLRDCVERRLGLKLDES